MFLKFARSFVVIAALFTGGMADATTPNPVQSAPAAATTSGPPPDLSVFICFGEGFFGKPCELVPVPDEGLYVGMFSNRPITSFGPDPGVVCLLKGTQRPRSAEKFEKWNGDWLAVYKPGLNSSQLKDRSLSDGAMEMFICVRKEPQVGTAELLNSKGITLLH